VAIKPAIKFKKPIKAGADDRIDGGKELCAKFAVPVTVDKTMTGIVKRILDFLYVKKA
jgi:hypothetical protein